MMTSLTITILKVSYQLGLSVEDLSEVGLKKLVDMCVSSFTNSYSLNQEISLDEDTLLLSLLNEYNQFVTTDMTENNILSQASPTSCGPPPLSFQLTLHLSRSLRVS
jgi:hypothetical protein